MLLDQALPSLDGAEALRRIRAIAPSLPLVLSIAYAQEGLAESLRGLRGWVLVEKPYDRAQFDAAVRAVCGGGAPADR